MSENHGHRLPTPACLCCFALSPQLSSDFFRIFPSLVAAYFPTSSGSWEISHTPSRISRKSVQSTEVATIITSPCNHHLAQWNLNASLQNDFSPKDFHLREHCLVRVKSPVCIETTVVLSPAALTDTSKAKAQQGHPRNINGNKNYRLRLKNQAEILWGSQHMLLSMKRSYWMSQAEQAWKRCFAKKRIEMMKNGR